MSQLMEDSVRKLALALLHADTEDAVVDILVKAKYWNNDAVWRFYGDTESNFSTIGNQQSRPEAALVEKVVNCVDARLMDECFRRRVDPGSARAPQSITDAVAEFFEEGRKSRGFGGHLKDWPQDRQLTHARFITLAVTGAKAKTGNASITIADLGEGQAPTRVPETFLSINRQNKLRIPFVQGKFNMGGTGVLKFCGRLNLQLIISRRDPEVVISNSEHHPDQDKWSLTIVRRERPGAETGAVRNSVYRYLAPVGADSSPNKGSLLTFAAGALKAMPERNRAYETEMGFGSVIKLFEYDMKGFKSHALMKGGLLGRLELLLPGIALPARVHECREYKGDEARSFENSLVGLLARLEEDRAGNLEEGYPTSIQIKVRGEEMVAQIFAFREDRATSYAPNDGIIFTVNGQTHGTLPRTFFERRNVRMQRIAKSLLIVVDCSALSVGSREDLFMNSRDRLSSIELRKAIEEELEEAIGHHAGLRSLQDRRRSEEVDKKLAESKPLEEVLGAILKSSPSLSRLFLQGQRLSKPHKQSGGSGENGGGSDEGESLFTGRPHPTFFRFHGRQEGAILERNSELGRRCRIKFDTDVINDYFSRDELRGQYHVEILEGPLEGSDVDHSISLHDGNANWSISIPSDLVSIGDILTVACTVRDASLIDPLVNIAKIRMTSQSPSDGNDGVLDKRKGRGQASGGGSGSGAGTPDDKGLPAPGGMQMPTIVEVREGDTNWTKYEFSDKDACYVVEDGDPDKPDQRSFTFYINVDNIFLKTEMKGKADEVRLVKARFVYGNVLVGLALLNDFKLQGPVASQADGSSGDDSISEAEMIRSVSKALGPFLVPMIDSLGALSDDQISGLAQLGDVE